MELPEETKIFLLESYENLDKVEEQLLSLERDPTSVDLLNQVFRSIHTIKGNSGFLGFATLETVCHRGEAVLDRLRSQKIKFDSDIGSLLLEFVDFVRGTLTAIESSGKDPNLDSTKILSSLDSVLK